MEVLGHSEIGVTMNIYTHVLAQLREDAADAIDRRARAGRASQRRDRRRVRQRCRAAAPLLI
jgi:hypothetical protein